MNLLRRFLVKFHSLLASSAQMGFSENKARGYKLHVIDQNENTILRLLW
jgi:hypothetical protein